MMENKPKHDFTIFPAFEADFWIPGLGVPQHVQLWCRENLQARPDGPSAGGLWRRL